MCFSDDCIKCKKRCVFSVCGGDYDINYYLRVCHDCYSYAEDELRMWKEMNKKEEETDEEELTTKEKLKRRMRKNIKQIECIMDDLI
jgi:hypothetical protein